jgi:hypothetical protein
MPGEPSWFNVSSLEAFEIQTIGLVHHKSNIIDRGENFYLRATITGDPTITEWYNMKTGGVEYRVRFFAKLMSPGDNDIDWRYTAWTDLSQDTFTVDSQTVNINLDGLYECGCWVEFRHANGVVYIGVLGYNKDCVIQVHRLEEPG